jgi:hypothetical protein
VNTTSKKFLDRGRECVFVGHSEETTSQYWVYAPDLGRAELAKTVDFDKNRQGGELDLRIRESGGVLSQGTLYQGFTSSAPPTRNPVGRPRQEDLVPLVTKLPKVLNNFSIEILARTPKASPTPYFPGPAREIKGTSTRTNDHSQRKERTPEKDNANEDVNKIHVETSEPVSEPPKADNQEESITLTDSPKTDALEPVGVDKSSVPGGATTGPAKRKDHDVDESSRAAKRVRALIAALITAKISELEEEIKESAFIATGGRIDVTIPKTYKEAILDEEHGEEWKEAIIEEITSLEANGT